MKSLYNYGIGDGSGIVLPPDPEVNDVLTIKFNVTNITAPAVVKADQKYNKDIVVSFGFDDALKPHFTHLFKLFEGGISGVNGQTYPGITFTDGAGKTINFKGTLVIPPAALRLDNNESNPNSLSIPDVYTMVVVHEWGISDHSWSHGAATFYPDRFKEVYTAQKFFYDKFDKYKPVVGTTPSSDDGFQQTFFNTGVKVHYSTYNEGRSDITVWGTMRPNTYPAGVYSLNRMYYGDDFTNPDVPAAWLQEIDKWFLNAPKNPNGPDQKNFYTGFTHAGSGSETNSAPFDNIFYRMKNHPDNTNGDRLALIPLPDFIEYNTVARQSSFNISVQGNVATLVIDQTNVDVNTMCRDMSLLLSGLNLQSLVSFKGCDSVTFNPASGLVNIYKRDRSRVTDPANDPKPAQWTSVIANGNDVIITFDKAVSQLSLAGFTIPGFSAQSISGNGRFWTVTFNSPVTNKFLSYRSFYGGGITVDNGIYVCDYIMYPIS
jgi:hypothetical protein